MTITVRGKELLQQKTLTIIISTNVAKARPKGVSFKGRSKQG